ncbi:MAG: signal peptidase I [Rhodospirillaceae bacterium]|jgi:signal peptidase I|nr:signal peptidase I [Rhodospirillaceae bacterium]|tara:strand:- start:527 stop:1261 length:735 start_codon:yes stop_codon:yes gene_type:complete
MDHRKSSGTKETIKTVIYAILIALGIRSVAYEPFNIPSRSMFPTLVIGDYLFVSKFSYGYSRYSLPFSLPLIPGRIFFTEPERGDVIVFKLPTDNRTDYIKRIIGLPGDTVQLRQSILYINGKPVEREKVDDFIGRSGPNNHIRPTRYMETLPNGRKHYILEVTENTVFDNTPVYKVPEGHYFAMGDNRDRSRDSRFLGDVGYIPRQNLIGRAEFLFFSVDGTVWEFWKWAKTLRFERFFEAIE